jgi:hypothetical protein
MEATAVSAIKPVTPDEAARVWRSIPNPSARRVAKVLTQAGRRVHFSTIARWRAEGWRPVSSGFHPIEAARQSLQVAARLLTGDPATGADGFVRQANADEPLGGLSDGELVRRSARDLLILQIVLCKVLASRGAFLVPEKPAETALLLRALANAHRAALLTFSQAR